MPRNIREEKKLFSSSGKYSDRQQSRVCRMASVAVAFGDLFRAYRGLYIYIYITCGKLWMFPRVFPGVLDTNMLVSKTRVKTQNKNARKLANARKTREFFFYITLCVG